MFLCRQSAHCCRLCQGCGANNDVLLAALGGALPGRTVMLQASGSFFAYEPILRALQTRQPMPLAHYIAASKLKPDAPEPPNQQARRADVGSMLHRLFDRRSGFGLSPCSCHNITWIHMQETSPATGTIGTRQYIFTRLCCCSPNGLHLQMYTTQLYSMFAKLVVMQHS